MKPLEILVVDCPLLATIEPCGVCESLSVDKSYRVYNFFPSPSLITVGKSRFTCNSLKFVVYWLDSFCPTCLPLFWVLWITGYSVGGAVSMDTVNLQRWSQSDRLKYANNCCTIKYHDKGERGKRATMSGSRKISGLPFLPGYTFRDLTVGQKRKKETLYLQY